MKEIIERYIDGFNGLEIIFFINFAGRFCVQLIDTDSGESLPVCSYKNKRDAERRFIKLINATE